MKLLGNWGPRCPNCLGAKWRYPKCTFCKGVGTVRDSRGTAWPVLKCRPCKGKGRTKTKCWQCLGSGKASNPG